MTGIIGTIGSVSRSAFPTLATILLLEIVVVRPAYGIQMLDPTDPEADGIGDATGGIA